MISKYLLLFMICIYGTANAQQNLFNIPSGDITPDGKVFFQQQINLYAPLVWESKSHFVYGICNRLDAGINLINAPLDFRKNKNVVSYNDQNNTLPLYPALLLTGQYNLLNKGRWKVNIGTQTGINITNKSDNIRLLYFNYGLASFNIAEKSKLMIGPYYVNKYLGGNEQLGLMAGFEIHVSKKIYLMGDFISGTNIKSATVLGGMYCISKRVQLCAGYLLPFPNEKSKSGIVLELNILGFDYNY